jgi:Fe-S oxidoreductase
VEILSLTEKIIFLFATVVSLVLTVRGGLRIVRIISRGRGRPDWRLAPKRIIRALWISASFQPTFQMRTLTSLFHGLVGWGFIFYLLVNLGDVLQGFIPDFTFLGHGIIGDIYRLCADLFSVSVLAGMLALVVRRYVLRPAELDTRTTTMTHPHARRGIAFDSALVAAFIILHVGARLAGESFHLAHSGPDAWQPIANGLSTLWAGMSPFGLEFARHAAWWVSLGLILLFLPYFPYTKHIHLFIAPLNFLLHPERSSMGALDRLDFEDQSIEQFGVSNLEHLTWKGLLDAYACIMCNRCQEACPAYATGKVLSPAAMEINKRYALNLEGRRLEAGERSESSLTEFAISKEAVWGCTACGACVQVCPVGNEPMRDILEIRQHLVLMENNFPEPLQTAFRGMERAMNPWSVPPEKRLDWAEGLPIKTVDDENDVELLWWVGCAPATDPQAQSSARAFAALLDQAGVEYVVLGTRERCTGDSARRSGNEYLFDELARVNVETLNHVAPKRIVTTCPHCLHTLKNEYPAFGGRYDVVHHTTLIQELLQAGRLSLESHDGVPEMTFHDPCYLGRQNGVFDAPREALRQTGGDLKEMPRSREQSFCCGAGGAQMWKEEEQGEERVSTARIREAQTTGGEVLAVACPFCKIMLTDAAKSEGGQLQVRDVVEILADRTTKRRASKS